MLTATCKTCKTEYKYAEFDAGLEETTALDKCRECAEEETIYAQWEKFHAEDNEAWNEYLAIQELAKVAGTKLTATIKRRHAAFLQVYRH